MSEVQRGVPLAAFTTIGLGGPAAELVTAQTEAELVEALRAASGPVLLLGGGSNLVVADEGFPGTVVRVASRGRTPIPDASDVLLEVAAGESWDELVAACVARHLAGIECLAGIPGLVGATPIQNVGAYGQDIAETVVSVRAYDRQADAVVEVADCGFGYRHSRFKAEPGRWLVLAVTYRLSRSDRSRPIQYAELAAALGVEVGQTAPLAQTREAVLALRRGKGMVLDPDDPDSRSAGSFFTNPVLSADQWQAVLRRGVTPPSYPDGRGGVKVPAAWLVEQAGFGRGSFDGPLGISAKHTLALVNRGGASTADLVRVARTVRAGVQERFGIELIPEPVLVGIDL